MSERTNRLFSLCRDAAATRKLLITGHDGADADAAISCVLLRELLQTAGINAEIALPTPPQAQACAVLARFGVELSAFRGEIRAEDALILCDHHATAHPAHVVACIDHHPTDAPPELPYVQIEPAGACALLVLRLFEEAGLPEDERRTALAVTALYLDTVALRSAKISEKEAAWARETAKRLGLDVAWLTREGLHLANMRLPACALLAQDQKLHAFDGQTAGSSSLRTDAMDADTLHALLQAAQEALKTHGAALWVLLVIDPLAERSTEYDIWPNGRVDTIRYDRVASRAVDVMPRVEYMLGRKNG